MKQNVMLAGLIICLGASAAVAQAPKAPDPNVFHDRNGNSCTPGTAETVCPALKSDTVSLPEISDLWRKDQASVLDMDYCVSAAGVPENIVVTRKSGVDEVDSRFVKTLQAWRFEPGTVGGRPSRLCGLNVSLKLKFD